MKFTHHAITSISVEKVENIYTSFTRAGNGDDTYRRQREKDKYVNCKKEQEENEERVREEFLKNRDAKLEKHAELTEKRKDKRNKKKERQKQLRNKHKLLKKLGQDGDSSSDEEDHPTLGTTTTAPANQQVSRPEHAQPDN